MRGREVAAPVAQKVIHESGSASRPMLTNTNFGDWFMLMKVILKALGYLDNQIALEAILSVVPPGMMGTLVVKPTTKTACVTPSILAPFFL